MSLTEDQFWKLFDTSRDIDSTVEGLYEVLADQVWQLNPDELIEFQKFLEERLVLANTEG